MLGSPDTVQDMSLVADWFFHSKIPGQGRPNISSGVGKMSLSLVPAYGRRYESEDQALESWNKGQDFKIIGGPYTSIRDIDLLKNQFGLPIRIFWKYKDIHYVEV